MKKQFQTESKKILDLMINSIYTNNEIFLRELISNASDAIDKRYYKILQNKDDSIDRKDFEIKIDVDKEARVLTISDNGIGMTYEDLENNLGTIAKSGSLDFKNINKDDEISIIGQFGVGFYSAFMVAKKIEVHTKSIDENKAYLWISEGVDGYEILEKEKDLVGTTIRLYLKDSVEDEEGEKFDDFLNSGFIQHLVKKYSNYIKYPIRMEIEKSRPVKKEIDGEEKTEFENYVEIETLNSMTPIWNKNKTEVSDEEYKSFYHAQRYGFDEPLTWIHLNAEGAINYRAILYIPTEKPMQYYTSNFSGGLELYSNGVMIMEKNEDLLPDYLSFVKGIVDSEDLSLNISREILQTDRRLRGIARNLEKKVLSELKNLLNTDRGKYIKFFEAFGLSLKSGIYESQGEKKKDLEDLLIYKTSKNKEYISLEEYLDNKSEEQKYIYYATGSSYENIDATPGLKVFKDKEIEVLYLDETLDEFVIKLMDDYREVKFKSVFDEKLDLDESKEDEETEIDSKNREELFTIMKDFLKEEVVEIRKTNRLKEDASMLTSKGEVSIEMEKTFAKQETLFPVVAQKVLEINTENILYKKMIDALSRNDKELIETITNVIYNQARLIAGLEINNVVKFTQDINSLIK